MNQRNTRALILATLSLVAIVAASGCQVTSRAGASFWGNIVALAVTIGIFWATLLLGRRPTGTTRSTGQLNIVTANGIASPATKSATTKPGSPSARA